MKNNLLLLYLILLLPLVLPAQKYLISDYNGQTVTTCGGVFYDSGDSTGNYANLENYTVTFCSNSGILYINFTNVNILLKDVMTIYDGPSTAYPAIKTFTYGSSPQTVYSSCGCLTIRFTSDKLNTGAGWRGVIGCSGSNDFIHNAVTLPLDSTYLVLQSNIGSTPDFSEGCFSTGNTVWYGFSTTEGNNTIEIYMQHSTTPDVQYLLLYDYSCSTTGQTASVAGTACGLPSDIVEFTGLTEGYYWLGVSSTTEGTFNIAAVESYHDVCGDYFCGSTESCVTCPFDCGPCPEPEGGPYIHPVNGYQDTYAGMCMVSTCTGNYYDSGGSDDPYANNTNMIYRTFCPDEPYSAVQAIFSYLDIDYSPLLSTCHDQLLILNGPTQNSDPLWSGCGKSLIKNIVNTYGSYGKGVFTSTHPSGCLTFRFFSDAYSNGSWEGWDATLGCVPSSVGPDPTYNNDCPNNIAICDDKTITSQVWGPGMSSEGCGSCVTSENFTEWYRIHVLTGGILELEITPLGNSDMDFAIYKADSCGNLENPIRCSYAPYAPPGKTGLSVYAGDIAEGVNGDQWVAELEIKDNDRYYLMVNEWDKREPNAYTIDFQLSGGATFDCSEVLPVSFLEFYAKVNGTSVDLIWKTATESNNQYFTVERSNDATNFAPLAMVDGAGNSNSIIRYIYADPEPVKGTAYYRIRQTDFDGNFNFSNVIAVDFLNGKEPWLNIYPNPSSDAVFVSCDASLIDSEYIIYNAAGAEVEYGTITSTHFKLPVYDLDEGAYYLSTNNAKKHPFMVLRNLK